MFEKGRGYTPFLFLGLEMISAEKYRLLLAVTFSLLLHLLLLILLVGGTRGYEGGGAKVTPIAVLLVPQTAKESPLETMPAVVAITTPSTLKVPEAGKEVHIDESKVLEMPPEKVAESGGDDQIASLPRGSLFPKAISLPWTQGLEVRPPNRAMPGAITQQKVGGMFGVKLTLVDTQKIIDQLTRELMPAFSQYPESITGRCKISGKGGEPHLDCDSAVLDGLIHNKKAKIVDALIAVQTAKKNVLGVLVKYEAGRLAVTFEEQVVKPKALP